jgi:hypothetical protein
LLEPGVIVGCDELNAAQSSLFQLCKKVPPSRRTFPICQFDG